MAKRGAIYATQIPVGGKKQTTKNPVGPVATGGFDNASIVPTHAGQAHGLGPIERPFGHPSVRGAHGYGHVAHMKKGHLRLSGYADAHRLGAHSPKKSKTAPKVG